MGEGVDFAENLSSGHESPVAWAQRTEREAVVAFLRENLEPEPGSCLFVISAIERGEHRA